MKRRIVLKPGYKAFTGKRLSAIHLETYNRIQQEINRYIDNKVKVPVWLLDHSHLTFRIISGELTK